jgi:hypothetical protein
VADYNQTMCQSFFLSISKSLICFTLSVVISNVAFAQGVRYVKLAFEGEPLPEGGQFSSFQQAVINNDDSVSFVGFTGSVASCSNSSVNLWKSIGKVIQSPVCGILSNFGSDTVMNDNGDLAFVPNSAVDSEVGGRHRVVQWNSTPVPGLEEETFDLVYPPALTNSGELNFWGSSNVSNTQGLWIEPVGEGSLEALVLEGDPAPGVSEGAVFTSIFGQRGASNHSGYVAFQAKTDDPPPACCGPEWGVWVVSREGGIRKVVAQKDELLGTAYPFYTTGSRTPSINNKGDVALAGLTRGVNESGVWAERWNESSEQFDLHNVAITGMDIQISETQTWSPLEFYAVAINSIGDVGYVGCSRQTTIRICAIVRATWKGTGFDSHVIAADIRIPGAHRDPRGAGFYMSTSQKFNMNAQSLFAFRAQTDFSGAWGLWGWRPDIGLRRVYLGGQPFALSAGEGGTVINNTTKNSTFVTTGGQDGHQRILNDNGMVVFVVEFETWPPESIRKEGVFLGDLWDSIFADSLEWQWSAD